MEKILNFEMEEFLGRLRTIKEFYDDGSRKILQQFSDYEEDWEEYETNAYEDLWSLSEIEDMHELYYKAKTNTVRHMENQFFAGLRICRCTTIFLKEQRDRRKYQKTNTSV